MVNPFEQTPAEKEEYVLDMLERGYGWNQIMKECHVSPNTISSVKKKFSGDDASKNTSQISKETQALKLFGEGKTLFEVAIELDIATDLVFVIYQNFLRLRNMGEFISTYKQVKGNIQPYLHLFDLMNGLRMSPEEVAQLAGYSTRLPYLGNIHSKLCNDVQILQSQKRYLGLQLNCAQNQLERYKASLEFYYKEYEMKRNELLALNYEIDIKKNVTQNFDNDEGYITIKEAARKEIESVMQDNRTLLAVVITATLEALRKYPASQELLFQLLPPGFSNEYQQFSIDVHKNELVELGAHIQSEIIEQITKKTTNMKNTVAS